MAINALGLRAMYSYQQVFKIYNFQIFQEVILRKRIQALSEYKFMDLMSTNIYRFVAHLHQMTLIL